MLLAEINPLWRFDIGIEFRTSGKYHIQIKIALIWVYFCVYFRIRRNKTFEKLR